MYICRLNRQDIGPRRASSVGVVALILMSALASAAELTIGAAEQPQTLDPQYGLFGQIQQAVMPHVFEPLFYQEGDGKTLTPLLATGYKFVDPSTLVAYLRKDVTFSDGTPFDAEDVAFTFERLPNPPGAAIPLRFISDLIEAVEIADSHTVIFRLTKPTPDFAAYLMEAPIISSDIGLEAGPAEFNSLRAAIGTGPYRITGWRRGDRIEYAPNERYWGAPAKWRRVTMRFMSNHSARVAALLAGDIDLMNYIPPSDIPRLERNAEVELIRRPSNRALFFHIDLIREVSPFVTALDGGSIPNPLKDVRVRRALSLAIDRPLIVEKIFEGYARPASQWIAPGYLGHDPSIGESGADRAAAQELIAAAGYAHGFRIVLHGTSGVYGADVRVLQAIAAMWAKLGLEVEVEAVPGSVYWSGFASRQYSVALNSWGLQEHRIVPVMSFTIASNGYDNVGGYSNVRVDELIDGASSSPVDERRGMVKEISRLLAEDVAILPVYHFEYVYAARRDELSYSPTENWRDLEVLRASPADAEADAGSVRP